MRVQYPACLAIFVISLSPPVSGQGVRQQGGQSGDDSSNTGKMRIPRGVILVKGAWSSASDAVTPVPEGGGVVAHVFRDPYLGMTYPLPPDWIEKYKGPPPSDSGRYVLAQISAVDISKRPARGSILITAQDMFFTATPARNAVDLIDYMKEHLQNEYQVEMPPKQIRVADRAFAFFAYWSPAAGLHWYILATQIRCHVVQIVLTSRDTKLLEDLMLEMNGMKLPAEASLTGGTGGGSVPVCIKDYARDDNIIARADPVFPEHRPNSVPVRIIIGKKGEVKHIHFLSAFPDQAKAISDALGRWKFKPYQRNGQLIEVETGMLFGQKSSR